jgi:hypothetical protein
MTLARPGGEGKIPLDIRVEEYKRNQMTREERATGRPMRKPPTQGEREARRGPGAATVRGTSRARDPSSMMAGTVSKDSTTLLRTSSAITSRSSGASRASASVVLWEAVLRGRLMLRVLVALDVVIVRPVRKLGIRPAAPALKALV